MKLVTSNQQGGTKEVVDRPNVVEHLSQPKLLATRENVEPKEAPKVAHLAYLGLVDLISVLLFSIFRTVRLSTELFRCSNEDFWQRAGHANAFAKFLVTFLAFLAAFFFRNDVRRPFLFAFGTCFEQAGLVEAGHFKEIIHILFHPNALFFLMS